MENKVFIPLDIEDEGKRYLLERGYQIKIATNVEKSTLIKEVADCDAILTRSNAIIDADVIAAGKKVKVISKYGVGLNNIDVDFATKLGIQVTNTPEANANVVAEHVMALMLALSKRVMIMDRELRRGNFDIRSEVYSEDLEGKTLAVLGLGRIGKLVAKKAAHGFEMKVIGYDPYPGEIPPYVQMYGELENVLKEADFISLHMPLLPATKHMISTEQFKLMKHSAFFINASRGGTVDERALVDALRNKTIAGGGIDVFEQEPPDTNDELFTLGNVIVTPHSAALSKEGSVKMAVHAAMQVDEVLRGKEPLWLVNNMKEYIAE
jgi:D-3-phosphoglycerate dehydrogenase